MNKHDIIDGLLSLRDEAETHITGDDDEVFCHDIDVLNAAIDMIRSGGLTGKWIIKPVAARFGDMTIMGDYPTCSRCDYSEIGVSKHTPYCPNCGAKMEE